MGLILLVVAVVLIASTACAAPTTCSRDYRKVGCFKRNAKLFADLVITDLDKTHEKWGTEMDWSNFRASIHSLACRCREKALGKYKYFALGSFGDCYGATDTKALEEKISNPGLHASTECVNGDFEAGCDHKGEHECAGTYANEFAYEIVDGCWSFISGGCVANHNIIKYRGKSLDECKTLCMQQPNCISFEYGVDHGGKGTTHKARDCQLQTSASYAGCDGNYHNLDLYIKKKCTQDVCPEGGIGYVGNDITGRKIATSWKKCSNLCRKFATCRFWTFTPSKNWCNLKNSDKGETLKSNQISGSRRCGIEPATYDCTFGVGDGLGAGEQWMGYLDVNACVQACVTLKKDDGTINGVTIYSAASKNGCWCKKTMISAEAKHTRYKTCFLKPNAIRCSGEADCCTKDTPCNIGEGNCNAEQECAGSLVCGNDNCPWGGTTNCCVNVEGLRCSGENDGCCTKDTPCKIGEGDCDGDQECAGSLVCRSDYCPWGDHDQCCVRRCTGQDDGCCTKDTPCNIGEGDCDSDQECVGSLVCGEDICPWGDRDDCCMKGLRCNGQDNGCCTKDTPCNMGEGDCDNDQHCAGPLVCGDRNCPWGDNDSCCMKALRCTGQNDGCCTKDTPCNIGEGECGNDQQCAGPLVCKGCPWGDSDSCCIEAPRCTGQDDGCCTKGTPCNIGEGDCDNDGQCAGSLVCGTNNCPWGDNDACCMKALRCNGQDDGCCIKGNPCNLGEGDCDNDEQCKGSLVCGNRNCPWGDNDSCCIKAPRCTGQNDGCCTKDTPCNIGEGDCDGDQECLGSLVCGEDKCPWGDGDDCCMKA